MLDLTLCMVARPSIQCCAPKLAGLFDRDATSLISQNRTTDPASIPGCVPDAGSFMRWRMNITDRS